MAIESLRPIAAALLVSLSSGCGPIVDRCQAGTLLVAVSLDSAAVAADELVVAISLDGGSAQETSLSHAPGTAAGNVVVQFPRGYPTGSAVSVVVTARFSGAVVGIGRAAATLLGSCQATTLSVAGASDDAASTDDLADVDLSTIDLSTLPPDLRPPPPDLYCPGGGVELCFDGVDNDCDNLVDCADPDCAPVATCVAAAPQPTWLYGTQEPAAGTCPAPTTSTTMYQADPSGGGCTNGCSCSAGGCSATLSLVNPCPGGTTSAPFATITNSTGFCRNIEFDNNFRISAVTGGMTCGVAGASTPVTPPVLNAARECTMPGTVVQGGCSSGQVCVARGTKQCVRAAGVNVACPPNYPNPTNRFPSYTDGRSCTCSCANGGCGAVSAAFFDSKNCGGTATPVLGDTCSNSKFGLKLVNGCTLSVNLVGSLQFDNATASTVCCP